MHEDPVIDFMVMEAVMVKAAAEDAEVRAEAERRAKTRKFKEDFSELEQYR
jgi:hypothetical protein